MHRYNSPKNLSVVKQKKYLKNNLLNFGTFLR